VSLFGDDGKSYINRDNVIRFDFLAEPFLVSCPTGHDCSIYTPCRLRGSGSRSTIHFCSICSRSEWSKMQPRLISLPPNHPRWPFLRGDARTSSELWCLTISISVLN